MQQLVECDIERRILMCKKIVRMGFFFLKAVLITDKR